MNKDELVDLVVKNFEEGYFQGYKDAEKNILSYFEECANEINFGQANLNEVLIKLIKICRQKKHKH